MIASIIYDSINDSINDGAGALPRAHLKEGVYCKQWFVRDDRYDRKNDESKLVPTRTSTERKRERDSGIDCA